MSFAGKVWRLLVGIKDGLALLFLLLFFALLYAALSVRPSPAQVNAGALLLALDGSVVEEATQVDPLDVLLSGSIPPGEYPVNDLVRAIDAAARDDRISAISLDLSRFTGGGQVHLQQIGEALDRFRAREKKVLAFAPAYIDESLQLAAHADEIWVDPLGGVAVRGPGGENLYYAGLIDKLKIKAHIFRVGTYKSAVEPYLRNDMSPEAREDRLALDTALWEEWKADVTKARPAARLTQVTQAPAVWLATSQGDLAQASKAAGLVDRIGDRMAYGQRLAQLVGEDPYDDLPGAYAHTELEPWLASLHRDKSGKAIGVVTIAGEIVDGDAGPGTAGGDRIAGLLDDALADDLAALVVRVDSPGGSVTASEEIRRAILRHKARGIPIVVSMANVAASGGYWVATPADRIFAEPATITGSIGVFAIIPTFEGMLGDWGVTGDGVRTTPLSGQPDMLTGLTPEVESMVQQLIEDNYARFLGLVAKARGKTPAQIDAIAQGRVWDGGKARQIGLVDQYGGLDDALAYAAQSAKLEDGQWHAKFLGTQEDPVHAMFSRMVRGEEGAARSATLDPVAALTARQQGLAARLSGDLSRLLGSNRAQAFCLSCPVQPAARQIGAAAGDRPGNALLLWFARLGE
jgi:protease-4